MDFILDGIKLMIAGMATVFVFLMLMYGWIRFCSRLCAFLMAHFPAYFQGAWEEPEIGEPVDQVDPIPVAVISAAIQRYRDEYE